MLYHCTRQTPPAGQTGSTAYRAGEAQHKNSAFWRENTVRDSKHGAVLRAWPKCDGAWDIIGHDQSGKECRTTLFFFGWPGGGQKVRRGWWEKSACLCFDQGIPYGTEYQPLPAQKETSLDLVTFLFSFCVQGSIGVIRNDLVWNLAVPCRSSENTKLAGSFFVRQVSEMKGCVEKYNVFCKGVVNEATNVRESIVSGEQSCPGHHAYAQYFIYDVLCPLSSKTRSLKVDVFVSTALKGNGTGGREYLVHWNTSVDTLVGVVGVFILKKSLESFLRW